MSAETKVNYKIGQVLWSAYSMDDDNGIYRISFSEWIATSIQNRKMWSFDKNSKRIRTVLAKRKVKGDTWIKLSKNHFDWGFAKNVSRWNIKKAFKYDPFTLLSTSRLLALKSCRSDAIKHWDRRKKYGSFDKDEKAKELKAIDRAIAKERAKK